MNKIKISNKHNNDNDIKNCIVCGLEIHRGHLGHNYWKTRKYCSQKCKGIGYSKKYGGKLLVGYGRKGWKIDMGYKWVRNYDNPGRHKDNYIPEHRLVMSKFLKRPLTNKELVHHINGNKTDNRIENLMLMTRENHQGEIKCPKCNYKFLIK